MSDADERGRGKSGKAGRDVPSRRAANEERDRPITLQEVAKSMEVIPLPATLIDDRGIVVSVNQAFLDHARSIGHPIRREDRIGRPIAEFATIEESRRQLEDLLEGLLGGGSTQHQCWKITDAAGRPVYVEMHAEVIRDAEGRIVGALILRADQTQQVQREQRRSALARMREAVWKMEKAGELDALLLVLRKELEMLDIPFQDLDVSLVDDSTEPPAVYSYNLTEEGIWREEVAEGKKAILRIWREGKVAYRRDLAVEDPYGEREYIERFFGHAVRSVVDVPFGRGTLAVNSASPDAFSQEDIDFLREMAELIEEGFRRAEDLEMLIRSEMRYRSLVETPDLIVFLMDLQGNYLYISPQIERWTGYPPEAFYADRSIGNRLIHPDDLDRVRQMFFRAAGEKAVAEEEFRWRGRRGKQYRWAQETLFPVRDEGGEMYALQAVVQDVTKRKEAENKLRESEERFRRLVETSFEGIVVHEEGTILEVNRRFCEMFGYEEGELIGKNGLELAAPESREMIRRMLQSPAEEWGEGIGLRKDGSTFPVELHGRPTFYQGRPARIAVLRDLTERKRMEQEMVRLERLRVAGELAAGVSHNLNNILTGVLGPAQLLQLMTDDPQLLQEIEAILTAGNRARDLVRRLSMSVRGAEEVSFYPVSVDRIVREAVETSRPRWKDEAEARGIEIEVHTRLGGPPDIRGTESGLLEVLTNLIFNAVDAMPEGGSIAIETRAVDGGAQIVCSDTGHGMDEETKKRVFEPFFTTKANVGSGLGLSTVYASVTGWGGRIELESEPGEGTTFTLFLPAWEEREAQSVRGEDGPC